MPSKPSKPAEVPQLQNLNRPPPPPNMPPQPQNASAAPPSKFGPSQLGNPNQPPQAPPQPGNYPSLLPPNPQPQGGPSFLSERNFLQYNDNSSNIVIGQRPSQPSNNLPSTRHMDQLQLYASEGSRPTPSSKNMIDFTKQPAPRPDDLAGKPPNPASQLSNPRTTNFFAQDSSEGGRRGEAPTLKVTPPEDPAAQDAFQKKMTPHNNMPPHFNHSTRNMNFGAGAPGAFNPQHPGPSPKGNN